MGSCYGRCRSIERDVRHGTNAYANDILSSLLASSAGGRGALIESLRPSAAPHRHTALRARANSKANSAARFRAHARSLAGLGSRCGASDSRAEASFVNRKVTVPVGSWRIRSPAGGLYQALVRCPWGLRTVASLFKTSSPPRSFAGRDEDHESRLRLPLFCM
jgi:hypothetical protein